MSIRVVLELTEQDLDYFRRVMDSVWKHNQKRAEKELVDGARRLLKQATKAGAPEYVRSRLAELEVIIEVIEKDRLLENTRIAGEMLVNGMEELIAKYPGLLSNARGAGTYAAVDARDTAAQGKILAELKKRGIEGGGSGTRSLRFRPALVFAPRHVAEALAVLEDACKAVG